MIWPASDDLGSVFEDGLKLFHLEALEAHKDSIAMDHGDFQVIHRSGSQCLRLFTWQTYKHCRPEREYNGLYNALNSDNTIPVLL